MAQNIEKQEPFLVKALTGETVKQVEVETSGGNISVESVAAGQERVEVYVWPSQKNNGGSVSKKKRYIENGTGPIPAK